MQASIYPQTFTFLEAKASKKLKLEREIYNYCGQQSRRFNNNDDTNINLKLW